jgi:tRNA threonylcarbamoyladenosine biosynthesis protein TsaB
MQTLLAIECSSHVNAVAYVADIDRPEQWVGETSREGAKASAWLLPAIGRVLAKAGAHKADVKIVAFGAGPGSFTGVRTACATAQALAYSWQASLIAVDCLEALAEASGLAKVDVLLDARMNELYVASFARLAGGELNRLSATALVATGTFVVREGAALLGSGAHLVAPASAPTTVAAEDRWAYGIARVAIAKFAKNEVTDPQYAEPIYVRNNVAQTEAQRAANAFAGGSRA